MHKLTVVCSSIIIIMLHTYSYIRTLHVIMITPLGSRGRMGQCSPTGMGIDGGVGVVFYLCDITYILGWIKRMLVGQGK